MHGVVRSDNPLLRLSCRMRCADRTRRLGLSVRAQRAEVYQVKLIVAFLHLCTSLCDDETWQ